MWFVDDIVDCGGALEIFVTGVAGIIQPNAGTVRIFFYVDQQRPDHTEERRLVMTQVWDISDWMAAAASFRAGREAQRSGALARRPACSSIRAH